MSIPSFSTKKAGVAAKPTTKKLKDTEAPKKALTPFFAFSNAEREKVKAELGTSSLPEVGKELGRRWAQLDPQAKAVYELESQKDKERFEEEMKNYKPSDEFLQKKAELEKIASERVVRPDKKAATSESYFTFLFASWQDVYRAHPGFSGKEVQDLVWDHWVGRQRGSTSLGDVPTKKIKTKKMKDPMAPKKPPTAYFLFANSIRASVMSSMPHLSYKEVLVELGKRWNDLDEAARAPFVEKVQALKADHEVAKEDYKQGKTEVKILAEEEKGQQEAFIS